MHLVGLSSTSLRAHKIGSRRKCDTKTKAFELCSGDLHGANWNSISNKNDGNEQHQVIYSTET